MTTAKILLTGAGGFIGSHLLRRLESGSGVHVISSRDPSMGRIDLESPGAARELVRRIDPDAVVHAAAMSGIAACEAEPARARRVNTDATVELAEGARDAGAFFLFFSTDQVFDGRCAPYAEDAATSPLHVYGETKARAEALLLRHPRGVAVVRPTLVFGPSPRGDRSASEMVLGAARDGRRLRLFTDEFRCPVAVEHVASAVAAIVEQRRSGVFHLAGTERISRHGLGMAVCGAFGLDPAFIDEGRAADLAAARRPLDLTLEVSASCRAIGLAPVRLGPALRTHAARL